MTRRSVLKTWKNTKLQQPTFEPLRATIPVSSQPIAAKITRFLVNELGLLQVSWWDNEVLVRGQVSAALLTKIKQAVTALDQLYTSSREKK